MSVTKTDLVVDLVRYINSLEKASKTVAYMTALLISWKDMDEAYIASIINETMQALDIYPMIKEANALIH